MESEIINNSNQSYWSKFKVKLTNFGNYLSYNTLGYLNNNLLQLDNLKFIQLYDKEYPLEVSLDRFKNDFNEIIYFSYRSNFNPIKSDKITQITSDCGWGCMVRSSQMILARGISQNSMSEINNNENEDNSGKRLDVLINTILLFLECKINDERPIFSIHNICDFGIKYGKGPGKWFSDLNMVGIFNDINQLNTKSQMEIITFDQNVIYEGKIIEKCFQELGDNENNSESPYYYQGKYFKFMKKGLIFISFRLGLNSIDQRYITPIKRLFSIKNNIGIIGGKKEFGLYFIGLCEKGLIYLDPHINQESIKNVDFDEIKSGYLNKNNLNWIEVEKCSTSMTFGVRFSNLTEYKLIRESLIKYSNIEDSIFKFSEANSKLTENYLLHEFEDYCVISE